MAGSPLRLSASPTPDGDILPWWSLPSRGPTFVSSLGGKYCKSNTLPNPRNCCLESCTGHAETFTLSAGSRVSHLPATQAIVPSHCDRCPEYLPVICLASFFSCLTGPFWWWAPTEKPQVALCSRPFWPGCSRAGLWRYPHVRLSSRLVAEGSPRPRPSGSVPAGFSLAQKLTLIFESVFTCVEGLPTPPRHAPMGS